MKPFRASWRAVSRVVNVIFGRRSKARLAVFAALFAAGIGLVFISQISDLKTEHQAIAQVIQALGESLLIASLLATVADPFVQQRFAEEWGLGVFWAIFNQSAPSPLRRAVNSIAQPDRYVAHREWLLELDWADEDHKTIQISIESHRRVICVDRDGWHPVETDSGIVTDCDGQPSVFTNLTVNAREWTLVLDEGNIGEHVEVDEHGTSRLMTSDLLKDHRVGYAEEVAITTGMRTKLRALDSIPLFSRETVLSWMVEVRGAAVPDLFIELFGSSSPSGELQPGGGGHRWIFRSKADDVTFPGYGIVLQWRPITGDDGKAGAAVAGL